ncbi:MAG: hypothetical protein U0L34_05140, partial [Paludibacteraceae bacterium]|nr:hypothetical protein [Paludibacteraceae bacterium]
MKQIILLVAFILLGVVIALLNKYARPKKQENLGAHPNLGHSTDSETESDSPNHQITESAAGEDDEYERPEGC